MLLSSCKSREQKIKEAIIGAIEMEIVSTGNYDGYHLQAKEDTLPRLSALFYAVCESKSVRIINMLRLFEQQYGYDILPETEVLSMGSYDISDKVNIWMAMGQEKHYVDLYEDVLSIFPRRDTGAFKEYIADAQTENRALVDVFTGVAASYDRDGNDLGLSDSYTVCRSCGKVFAGDSVARCDVCGAGPDKLYVYRATDFPVPEMEMEQDTEAGSDTGIEVPETASEK